MSEEGASHLETVLLGQGQRPSLWVRGFSSLRAALEGCTSISRPPRGSLGGLRDGVEEVVLRSVSPRL